MTLSATRRYFVQIHCSGFLARSVPLRTAEALQSQSLTGVFQRFRSRACLQRPNGTNLTDGLELAVPSSALAAREFRTRPYCWRAFGVSWPSADRVGQQK